MSERSSNEKGEKQEKGEGESWDEKWRRDPVDAVMWAVLLIWGGLVLLGNNMGLFDDMALPAWSMGFIGAGVIVLLAAAFRLAVPAYRRPLTGNLIFGAILIGIGLGEVIGWVAVGPLVLIAIGLGILVTGILRRR
jgi:prepilin signal peptidase PulO-like enzyme (type II secretory pathway)